MSAISNSLSTNPAPSTTNAFQALTSEDFIRIMFSELTNQDPSAPNDSKELLQQIGTIRSIESDLQLTDRLEEIALQNEISASGTLLGAFVVGLTDSGTESQGFVDSVSVTREGTILNLSSNQRVRLKAVKQVIDPALIQPVSNTSTTAAASRPATTTESPAPSA